MNLEKYRVIHVAGDILRATYGDNFVLYYDYDCSRIEIIIDEEFAYKTVKVCLGEDVLFNGVLRDTSLYLSADFIVDLDMLARDLKILQN